jgi:hypothetical protein
MTLDVQARMKAMNTELDERLKHISIDDVNLSVRTLNALKKGGVRTLYDALKTLIDKQLHTQHGIGRKTLSEIKEAIWSAKSKFPPPPEVTRHTRRLELNSLLLAYETHVLALYTYQRADVDNERFRDIDLGASIVKRKAAIERVRKEILKYADFKED